MRTAFLLTIVFLIALRTAAQSGTWVWLNGSNVTGSAGFFGTQGVPGINNAPPCRYQAAYWMDLNGNFWVFGGSHGISTNDLWKYNPATNQWTWMRGDTMPGTGSGNYGTKGVPSPLVDPPGLGWGANCWTDLAGDLWLFGGYSTSSGDLSDNLFRYNIATNQWTWMNGNGLIGSSANYGPKGVYGPGYAPGARAECKSGWTIGNELWLFGGDPGTILTLGDLWSYNINTNLWAWRSGSTTSGAPGVYGTKGVASPTNLPPARYSYTKWQDQENLYLFAGGSIQMAFGNNDTWKFNLNTQEWTWISGSSIADDAGLNGSYCVPDTLIYPRSRIENQTAQTLSKCVNAFWSFGGFSATLSETHNDLWIFDASNNKWTKVSGYTSTGGAMPGYYGIKGVPDPLNLPPGRGGHCLWSDQNANLFLFGGMDPGGAYNDMWKFVPDTSCSNTGLIGSVILQAPADTDLCAGDTITMMVSPHATIQVLPNYGYTYNSSSNRIQFYGPSSTTYTVTAQSISPNDPCFTGDTVSFTIAPVPPPMADFIINPTVTTMNAPVFNLVNTSMNAVSYAWYNDDNQLLSTDKDLVRTEEKTGQYCYTLKVKNKCGEESVARKCADIVENGRIEMPNAFSPNGDGKNDVIKPVIIGRLSDQGYRFTLYNRWGQQLFDTKDPQAGWNGLQKGVPCEMGVYFYVIKAKHLTGKQINIKGDITLLR